MRKNQIFSELNRVLLITLIIISTIAGSCSTDAEKKEYGELIPKDDFISILVDVYISDGLLTVPKIHTLYTSIDSVATFDQIVKLNGYSREAMDNTIRYYFVKKPKKLVEIYDQVLAVLSEMESRILEEAPPLVDKTQVDLWTGEKFFSYPDPTGKDTVNFSFVLSDPGIYSLIYSVRQFPDDQTLNARTTAYTTHADSAESGKRSYLKTYDFIKDGQKHTYAVIVRINTPLSLNGSLYDYENNPDEWGKHAVLDSVYLINYSIQK